MLETVKTTGRHGTSFLPTMGRKLVPYRRRFVWTRTTSGRGRIAYARIPPISTRPTADLSWVYCSPKSPGNIPKQRFIVRDLCCLFARSHCYSVLRKMNVAIFGDGRTLPYRETNHEDLAELNPGQPAGDRSLATTPYLIRDIDYRTNPSANLVS